MLQEHQGLHKDYDKLKADLVRFRKLEGTNIMRHGRYKGKAVSEAIPLCEQDIAKIKKDAVQMVQKIRQAATSFATAKVRAGSDSAKHSLRCIMDNASNALKALDDMDCAVDDINNAHGIDQQLPFVTTNVLFDVCCSISWFW